MMRVGGIHAAKHALFDIGAVVAIGIFEEQDRRPLGDDDAALAGAT